MSFGTAERAAASLLRERAAAARAARAGEGRPEWLRSQALALRETPRIDEDEGGEAA